MGEVNADWQYGLCGCCSDTDVCCLGCWCPCILYGNTQSIVKGSDKDQSCIFGIPQRMKVREVNGLPEKTCADVCTHVCCHGCALCQEARQMKYVKARAGEVPPQQNVYDAPAEQNMMDGHKN
eukprot:TRINITY_DN4933_c1_g1_i2.p2 TRINITY_DN4933_c1_g1~~TRINITY_DN4933_c1_g1_i2.p2  ORF type:complete len:123 (-),score=10.16 TRINITY_DN4933_c1_g1_i2:333-701(-)